MDPVHMGKKRWWLFSWTTNQAIGGMDDFVGYCVTPEEALEYFKENQRDEDWPRRGMIVDTENMHEEEWMLDGASADEVVASWVGIKDEVKALLPGCIEI